MAYKAISYNYAAPKPVPLPGPTCLNQLVTAKCLQGPSHGNDNAVAWEYVDPQLRKRSLHSPHRIGKKNMGQLMILYPKGGN